MLAAAVAELDADDDETGGGELVAPATVRGTGGLQHHHPAAVEVQHARQRTGAARRAMQVDRDVVAVEALDDLHRALHAGDVGQPADGGAEQGLEALLGSRHVLQQVVQRSDSASTGAGAARSASPNGSIAAIMRGSARGSSRKVIPGDPSRPGSTGELVASIVFPFVVERPRADSSPGPEGGSCRPAGDLPSRGRCRPSLARRSPRVRPWTTTPSSRPSSSHRPRTWCPPRSSMRPRLAACAMRSSRSPCTASGHGRRTSGWLRSAWTSSAPTCGAARPPSGSRTPASSSRRSACSSRRC